MTTPYLDMAIIGNCRIYLGDCYRILPWLMAGEPGLFNTICSDPPYGQNHDVNVWRAGRTVEHVVITRGHRLSKVRPKIHKPVHGDDKPFDPSFLVKAAKYVLLWGQHKFGHRLPEGSTLVWDKRPTGMSNGFGDGETAWLNIPGRPLRIFRLLWNGLCVGKGARHEVTAGQQRLHPTQKPEILMRWSIEQFPDDVDVVCDPFMGAGATGVAAVQLGLGFVGIEIDPDYFAIACDRVREAYAQGALPGLERIRPIEAEQADFLLGGG